MKDESGIVNELCWLREGETDANVSEQVVVVVVGEELKKFLHPVRTGR